MRYVPIDSLVQLVFEEKGGQKVKERLVRAHQAATGKTAEDRKTYIDKRGATKWTPLKNRFTAKLGNKCWYTEAELVGASLTIDHYRPKCDYWYLAFEANNYRVACPFANSPKHNEEHGCMGGKGDEFPLLNPERKATNSESIQHERPIILDPCNRDDCNMIAFLPDGRPVIHPAFKDNAVVQERVERSKILLNLDHPDFNSQREQLHDSIKLEVGTHEALPEGSDPQREALRAQLTQRIAKDAPFSVAARQYLSAFRHLDWVVGILDQSYA